MTAVLGGLAAFTVIVLVTLVVCCAFVGVGKPQVTQADAWRAFFKRS